MRKLAVGVRSKFWYKENDPDESIRYITDCGFEAMDYAINERFDFSFDKENMTSFFDKSLEELYEYYRPLKEALEKYDFSMSQAHGIFQIYTPGEDALNDYRIQVTEKMMAVCNYLDCRAIVIHPWTGSDLHKDEEKEINLSIYRRLIPAAKKYKVKVCLENLYKHRGIEYFEGACTDAYEACWYVDTLNKEAGEDVFGFCLDTGHIRIVSRNLYQFITTLGKRIEILHIHDNDGTTDSHMFPYTQMDKTGELTSTDWEMFIRGLREIGYEGAISFESSRGVRIPPIEVRKSALRFLSDIGKYFRKRIEE